MPFDDTEGTDKSMYDIMKEIWREPGASFSPFPFWFWNDKLDTEKLVSQLNEFHKKGIDGVVIHPRMGMSGMKYLSDEYFAAVRDVLEAAKKRRMQVLIYDDAMYPSGSAHGEVVKTDRRLASRKLYAAKDSEKIPEGEELLFRIFVRLTDDGYLDSVSLGGGDGYEPYKLILGYTGGTMRGLAPDEDDGQPFAPPTADILNPYSAERFIRLTHERYYSALHDYFGNTIVGFFTDEPSVTGRNADMKNAVPWTYGMIEDWFDMGGDFDSIAALLFGTKAKKPMREAEYILEKVIRKRLNESYYAPISKWCREHGVALTGHPASSTDIAPLEYFDIPGQDLVWRQVEPGTELTSPDSVLVKCASDTARHSGISRSSVEVFGVCGERGNPWNFTPDDMMWYLNFIFARGCSMVVPHAFYYSLDTALQSGERPPDVGQASVWWKDYRRVAGYIKRMSWLGATGTNNPDCAVLCDDGDIPYKPVKPLYENGYTFNYLSLRDLMHKAHIENGEVHIDRYVYKIILVDPSLRLDAEIVKHLGEFAVHGGILSRSADFLTCLEKHVKKTSYFAEDGGKNSGNIRFVHYTKSGCPFFLIVNEGDKNVTGHLVTDIGCAAELFDAFTGKTTPLRARLADGGFSYRLDIGAHSSAVVGMNPDALVSLDENEEEIREYCAEVISLADGRMSFFYDPSTGYSRAVITAERVCDRAELSLNGQDAGTFLFKPYSVDVTELLSEGENTLSCSVTPSPAMKYGNGADVGVYGLCVRFYKMP